MHSLTSLLVNCVKLCWRLWSADNGNKWAMETWMPVTNCDCWFASINVCFGYVVNQQRDQCHGNEMERKKMWRMRKKSTRQKMEGLLWQELLHRRMEGLSLDRRFHGQQRTTMMRAVKRWRTGNNDCRFQEIGSRGLAVLSLPLFPHWFFCLSFARGASGHLLRPGVRSRVMKCEAFENLYLHTINQTLQETIHDTWPHAKSYCRDGKSEAQS